jgi:hypothetical protein
MKEYIDSLIMIERKIAKEKGALSLFALFLREDSIDRWDLLISSPDFEKKEKEALVYIVGKLRSILKKDELKLISRIIILRKNNKVLEAVHKAIKTEHSSIEVKDSVFFGLKIKHAFIITSQPL